MQKKIKNIFYVLFILVFAIILSACTKSNNTTSANNTTKKEIGKEIEKETSLNENVNENTEIDVKAIAIIEEYHDLILDISKNDFLDAGFQVGDMAVLTFKDDNGEHYEMEVPICDYYNQVNRDDTAIVIDNEKVKIAMHNLDGDGFSDVYNVENEDIIYNIRLIKKGGYDIDKFVLDNFDFDETTSVNNSKKMLDEYKNIYIVCKGVASEDLDMNFFVTSDYVMIKTNKFLYFSDGKGESRYKDGKKVTETTYTEYNDKFNTDILHFDSEKVIDKKIEDNNLIIRTSSTDLRSLPKLHILAIDSYMNDGPNENLRLEKTYIFDKNTRRLISYDSFLCKNDKPNLHLQKVSGIFSNVKLPSYCKDLIKAMNYDVATASNARANVIVFKATSSDAKAAPYNQEKKSSNTSNVKVTSLATSSNIIK